MKHPASPENEDVRLNSAKIARKCACQGWAIGIEASSADNSEAVTEHQQTAQHRDFDWDAWREQNTAQTEVPIATLRKIA